jgi:hypothetical protein
VPQALLVPQVPLVQQDHKAFKVMLEQLDHKVFKVMWVQLAQLVSRAQLV